MWKAIGVKDVGWHVRDAALRGSWDREDSFSVACSSRVVVSRPKIPALKGVLAAASVDQL